MGSLGNAYFEYARTQRGSLDPVWDLLVKIWGRDTARPDRQGVWTPQRPEIGHDDVIAYVASTDLLGGLIVQRRQENGEDWFALRQANGEGFKLRDYCAAACPSRVKEDVATFEAVDFLAYANGRGWDLTGRADLMRARLLAAIRSAA